MTKKHFEDFASHIRAMSSWHDRAIVAKLVADVAEKHNPRFKRTTFYEAANVAYKVVKA